jgi:hypothetical protein
VNADGKQNRREGFLKELKEMSWTELDALRKDLEKKLGEDVGNSDDGSDDDDDADSADQLNTPDHWLEDELVEALGAVADLKEATRPGPKQGAPKSPPKGYPSTRDQYADPENYKYPLDTEAHARAALGYFSKASNRSGYSGDEQKFMWKRIIAAAKRYDIELSDDVKKHAEKLGDPDQEVLDLDEKKLTELITAKVKEQMEAYAPQVRVPPDIAEIKNALDGFKSKCGEYDKKFGELGATFPLSAMKAMAEKWPAMEAMLTKATTPPGNGNGDNDKDTEKLKKEKEAAAVAAKVKEQATVPPAGPPVPQGQVATSEMTSNTEGVKPPSFPKDDEEPPQGFREVMDRAGRRRK